MQNTVTSETTNSSAASAGGPSNTNASTTTNSSAAAGGTPSSDIEPNKFPTHLISMDSRNDDGEQIFKSILLLAKNAGGWSNAFGHKKKDHSWKKLLRVYSISMASSTSKSRLLFSLMLISSLQRHTNHLHTV